MQRAVHPWAQCASSVYSGEALATGVKRWHQSSGRHAVGTPPVLLSSFPGWGWVEAFSLRTSGVAPFVISQT
eukprot:13284223-Alexandrium_andersonii.AAC.1